MGRQAPRRIYEDLRTEIIMRPLNFLCISSEFKGQTFLRACHEQGNNVYLLTCEHLQGEDWPHDIIKNSFYLPEKTSADWKMQDVIAGLAFTSRNNPIDRVVALDDFDVEIAANLREYFRIPGMGQTTARHFRDKLSMRMKAAEHGIPIPAFTAMFNDGAIEHFCNTVPAPWLIKPRTAASASGIQKITNTDELASALEGLVKSDTNIYWKVSRPELFTMSIASTPKESRCFRL